MNNFCKKISADMRKQYKKFFFGYFEVNVILILVIFVCFVYVLRFTPMSIHADFQIPEIIEIKKKPEAINARGLYLTAYSANDSKKRAEIIELIKNSILNSVVVDIKDYTGYIMYERPDYNDLWISKKILENPRDMIDDFHKDGIYVIARQTVFQDPILAETRPELAVKNSDGNLWQDYKGLKWVDPTKREIWDYNLEIAKHAISLGFDEINFDYVRFPSDGDMKKIQYSRDFENRTDIMSEFYEYLGERLKDEPAYISLDFFGLVLDNNEFDLNIGQRLKDALTRVDYVCPMTYPSHYPSGYLGFSNPADYPYEVIKNGLNLSEHHFATSTARARLRPWLQAFDIGAVYEQEKIQAQINAVEENIYSSGWFLWNARNVYDKKGINNIISRFDKL